MYTRRLEELAALNIGLDAGLPDEINEREHYRRHGKRPSYNAANRVCIQTGGSQKVSHRAPFLLFTLFQ